MADCKQAAVDSYNWLSRFKGEKHKSWEHIPSLTSHCSWLLFMSELLWDMTVFPTLQAQHTINHCDVLLGPSDEKCTWLCTSEKYSNTSTKSCEYMVHCDQWDQGHVMQFAIMSRPCIIILFYILLYYWVWYPNYFILLVIMSNLFYIIVHYILVMLYYWTLYPSNVILLDIIS